MAKLKKSPAGVILSNKNTIIAFNVTTQDRKHTNEIHFTTRNLCVSAAVDELPGGSAEDYSNHICQTLYNMAKVYRFFNQEVNYQETRTVMIGNIPN